MALWYQSHPVYPYPVPSLSLSVLMAMASIHCQCCVFISLLHTVCLPGVCQEAILQTPNSLACSLPLQAWWVNGRWSGVLCILLNIPCGLLLNSGIGGTFYSTAAAWFLKPSSWSLFAQGIAALYRIRSLGSVFSTLWSLLGFVYSSVTWSFGQVVMILFTAVCSLIAIAQMLPADEPQQGGQRRAGEGQGGRAGGRAGGGWGRARTSNRFPEGFGPLQVPAGSSHPDVLAVLKAEDYYEVS